MVLGAQPMGAGLARAHAGGAASFRAAPRTRAPGPRRVVVCRGAGRGSRGPCLERRVLWGWRDGTGVSRKRRRGRGWGAGRRARMYGVLCKVSGDLATRMFLCQRAGASNCRGKVAASEQSARSRVRRCCAASVS